MMKLNKLKIRNFRCFGEDEQTIFFDDLTAFIGNNSSGKTAALAALNCLFGEAAGDRMLRRSDFHIPSDQQPDEIDHLELSIEAVFSFPELEQDGTKFAENTIPLWFGGFTLDQQDGSPYLRIRLMATWERDLTMEGNIDAKFYYVHCSEQEKDEEPHLGNASRHELSKIRMIYVPAVRDPSLQLRNHSKSLIYQFLRSINWSEDTKEKITEKLHELNGVFGNEKAVQSIDDSIRSLWKKYDPEERYSDVRFKISESDLETILQSFEVSFSPTELGTPYSIDQMSDGLRSLFYISLMNSCLKIEDQMLTEKMNDEESLTFNRTPPVLTLFAIEEPENHIAPHLLGRLIVNLEEIKQQKNAQVMITSHSPAIIKRIEPENMRYFRRDSETKVKSITLPERDKSEKRYKYIKEAVRPYPELYFAKLVIFGEGDSEELLIFKFWEIFEGPADLSGVAIVPLGGRIVHHFWKLLEDLRIPYITLLDLDRERDGGGFGRIQYVLKELLELKQTQGQKLLIEGEEINEALIQSLKDKDIKELDKLEDWLRKLEKNNVFFSSPLDIDFLMLEHLESEYKRILRNRQGPHCARTGKNGGCPEQVSEDEKRQICSKCMEAAVQRTLKEGDHGDGATYSEKQKKLMKWYNYLFLDRGKPSTHLLALLSISDDELKKKCPPVIKKILKAAQGLLGKENEANKTL